MGLRSRARRKRWDEREVARGGTFHQAERMTTSPESLSEIYNYRAIGEQLGRTALLHQPRREPIAPRLSSQRRQPYDLARRRRQQPGVFALRHRRLPRNDGGWLGDRLVHGSQHDGEQLGG